jgi:hypothetical protein
VCDAIRARLEVALLLLSHLVLDILEVGVAEIGCEREGVQGAARSMPMGALSEPVKGRGKREEEGADLSTTFEKQEPKRPPSKHVTSSTTQSLSGWLSHARPPMSTRTCRCWPARQPVRACGMWICEKEMVSKMVGLGG